MTTVKSTPTTVRRTGSVIAAVVLSLALLSGCATKPVGITNVLQNGVLNVAKAAAAGDTTNARAALSTLKKHVATALADSTITTARATAIYKAIAVVDADLTPADKLKPTTTPEPSSAPKAAPTIPAPRTSSTPAPVAANPSGGTSSGQSAGNPAKSNEKEKATHPKKAKPSKTKKG